MAAHQPKGPRAGERVLGCKHNPDVKACHLFYFPEKLTFARQDNPKKKEARWFVCCHECASHTLSLMDRVRLELMPEELMLSVLATLIGYDRSWPKGAEFRKFD
jgi:hypothetical protein